VSNPDRLSALDSTFLHLERNEVHMHVASCIVFEGRPPAYGDLLEHLERRLHLVPRYRQRLAQVPFEQGRPVWVDDPHFNARYHLRHTALPRPGSEEQLRNLTGRVFSQVLDRSKPLWEMWLVEKLEEDRFAILAKTHHALVDGISGVDLTTVLLDATPDAPPPAEPDRPWVARPMPSATQLLADALLERATVPAEIARGARALLRAPRRVASRVARDVAAIGSLASAGLDPAPPTPLNQPIGPHRRFGWTAGDLAVLKATKNRLGGTVNDAILTVVTLGLGRFLRARGHSTEGLELRAMVPVSVRADVERGALGNRVAAMWAPLPVHADDPIECFARIHGSMRDLKGSGQAVGAQVLTQLGDFAPPTILVQAARLQSRQRLFNLVITNIPGPQFSLYLLGRRMQAIYPQVPLASNQGLGIAIMSYDGGVYFGFNADYDALPDVDALVGEVAGALEELEEAAGVGRQPPPTARRATRRTAAAAGKARAPAERTKNDRPPAVPPPAVPSVRSDVEPPAPAFSMPRSRPRRPSRRRPSGTPRPARPGD